MNRGVPPQPLSESPSPVSETDDPEACSGIKNYNVVNGTSYDSRTPDGVIRVLEQVRLNRTRLHVSLGHTDGAKIGLDWLEEFESHGYIGRSTVPIKVPLLVANRRSLGGGALLDYCIVRIRQSVGERVLWQHLAYRFGNMEIRPKAEPVTLPDSRVLTVDVLRDGDLHAAFENMAQARRWVQKMGVVAPIAV